ncbi:hypothetical protein JHK82_044309 [Glycine max]|nr:hypothetical protein JHK82_044309 [Glycine max]
MESARISHWLNLLVCVLLLLKAEGSSVPLTLVKNSETKGAVCLDGSPPAYHFDKGFGKGINNWIVHIEGGGWCNNVTSCLDRKNTTLGSSNHMSDISFYAILSNQQQFNPDFYNWNRVKVRYCDGSSFTGDVEEVDPAILSGCSAGGLTTILHCDSFKALLPSRANVKCVPDAGYFVNVVQQRIYPHLALQNSTQHCVFFHNMWHHISVPQSSLLIQPMTGGRLDYSVAKEVSVCFQRIRVVVL